MNDYIQPTWPQPNNVKAYTTKRTGGISQPPYDSFNFSLLTGDNPSNVLANRKKLSRELNLPREPFWLKQIHSNIVLHLEKNTQPHEVAADASFTTTAGPVCVVQTADCVPILVCNEAGTIVAAIHAGWKGITVGIIGASIKAMDTNPAKLLAWLGPAIGPKAFIVNQEIREIFCQQLAENKSAFIPLQDRFLANIYLLVTAYLKQAGITKIYGGEYCTFTQKDMFFSFRRDGEKSGRMASLIWLEN